MATILQLRRGLASDWISNNPILASGEAGVETDTNKFKFGDGITSWTSLPYVGSGSDYELPTASTTTLGGVIVDGTSITILDGVISSSGSGTTDYDNLTDKPSINSVTLSGNKTSADLGLQPSGSYLTSESDPIFTASQANNITSEHISVLNNTSGINTGDQDLSGKLDKNTAITGATKTKITYDADGLVTSGEDATTADITDSLNKRYVSDANLTVLGNTSNTNTGDETNITIKTKLGAELTDIKLNSINAMSSVDDDFSIILLPDTQNMVASYPAVYENMMNWIVTNKSLLNIKAVIGLGDVTNAHTSGEFAEALVGWNAIKNADIPYMPLIGNHDYDAATAGIGNLSARAVTVWNTYLPTSYFSGKSWFGGTYNGTTDNYYTKLTIGSKNYLFLCLEFFPRTEVLNWAQTIIDANPNHFIVLTTHAYINESNSRYTDNEQWGTADFGLTASNNGQDLWDNFIKINHIGLVLCGHISLPPYSFMRADSNIFGELINQLMVDYQAVANGGNGYLTILNFKPSTGTIDVKTYSPYLSLYDLNGAYNITQDNPKINTSLSSIYPITSFSDISGKNLLGNGQNITGIDISQIRREYGEFGLSSDITSAVAGDIIPFSVSMGNMTLSSNKITLKRGRVYDLMVSTRAFFSTTVGKFNLQLWNFTDGVNLAPPNFSSMFLSAPSITWNTSNFSGVTPLRMLYSPTKDISVGVTVASVTDLSFAEKAYTYMIVKEV